MNQTEEPTLESTVDNALCPDRHLELTPALIGKQKYNSVLRVVRSAHHEGEGYELRNYLAMLSLQKKESGPQRFISAHNHFLSEVAGAILLEKHLKGILRYRSGNVYMVIPGGEQVIPTPSPKPEDAPLGSD